MIITSLDISDAFNNNFDKYFNNDLCSIYRTALYAEKSFDNIGWFAPEFYINFALRETEYIAIFGRSFI